MSYWQFFNVCSCHRNAAQVEGMKKTQGLKEHDIPHIEIFKNTLGHLLMGRLTVRLITS
jgi:hypothetical protein